MVISVVRNHHFTPDVIDGFFLDAVDYHGLEFWYNEATEAEESIKPKK